MSEWRDESVSAAETHTFLWTIKDPGNKSTAGAGLQEGADLHTFTFLSSISRATTTQAARISLYDHFSEDYRVSGRYIKHTAAVAC